MKEFAYYCLLRPRAYLKLHHTCRPALVEVPDPDPAALVLASPWRREHGVSLLLSVPIALVSCDS